MNERERHELEAKILEAVTRSAPHYATTKSVAQELGLPQQRVAAAMFRMAQKGSIVHHPTMRATYEAA